MRKPAYLVVLGISIVVAAGSLGMTLSRYLSLRAYAPKAAARPSAVTAGRGGPTLPPEQWTNLFAPAQGMKLPSRLPAANAKSAPRSAFVLVGTIVSSSPAARRAILWANGMKQPKAFREKEEVEPGAILSSVERDKAWITRGNEREMLEILPVGSKVRASIPPSPVAAPGAPQAAATSPSQTPGDIKVERLADNRFSIDEAGVAQLSGNFNQFMTQVRMVPYFEGNKAAGYRLAAIRPGTTFDRLGFQGGDILQQVNGVDLSTPEKIAAIFQNLKDEKKVSVNIVRQGQKNTLTYEIR
ncbi:type II secretion system protein GspC [Candidatus Deferrimicrobium sp.]|uniref:type II secretion system protein GspC n=1 Tax=Candidatus Deferrimicrobium sp. TaxID=3060586 RepID=UPI002ECFC3DF